MSENNKLEKRQTELVKEKSQYAIAFGVIAMMLYITGFPLLVIFFFGILAYFIWKTLSTPSPNGTREIFEFYLMANEILRDDDRRWYGFEMQEVIGRGERIIKYMNGAPPLVYFTLGALYNKMGDHKSAVNHLSYVFENEHADEKTLVDPSPELRSYVRTLRKIEREPAEAPLMSAAVRALERARRNRGHSLLETSREQLTVLERRQQEKLLEQEKQKVLAQENRSKTFLPDAAEQPHEEVAAQPKIFDDVDTRPQNGSKPKKAKKDKADEEIFANRKSISEVLHDIYDKNNQ